MSKYLGTIWKLLKDLKVEDQKETIVASMTNGKTASLRDCSEHQILQIYRFLKNEKNKAEERKVVHKKSIFGLMYNINKYAPHLYYIVNNKINQSKLQNICLTQAKKKDINTLGIPELKKIITHLKLILNGYARTTSKTS